MTTDVTMATIKEDCISFEIAKLLKEKGFDWYTYDYYEDEDNPNISLRASKAINWNKTEFISKPTLQTAMKWLRETHRLYIQVVPDSMAGGGHIGYYVVLQNTTSDFKIMLHNALDNVLYDTYEEAVEAALKYCLKNLIK